MNLGQYVKENPTATLEEVQNYEEVIDTKQVGSGQARGFFITEDTDPNGSYAGQNLWSFFNSLLSDSSNPLFPLASAIIITASDGSSYFGMDETKADGIANRAGIAGLVAMGVMSQNVADKFIAKTISTSYPFADVEQKDIDKIKEDLVLTGEEVFTLPNSTQANIYTLTITKNSPKATSVKIMQRFGTDENDLTEWHQVGQFSNVKYKQQTYKTQIGACTAAYRELKVVSEYLLDMRVS